VVSDEISTALIIGAFLAMAVAFIAGRALTHKPELGRRVYWGGWAVAIPLFALGMAAPFWPNVVAAVSILGIASIGLAYVMTPYLTISGYTYTMQDRFRSGE
jgi:hypothetical protein